MARSSSRKIVPRTWHQEKDKREKEKVLGDKTEQKETLEADKMEDRVLRKSSFESHVVVDVPMFRTLRGFGSCNDCATARRLVQVVSTACLRLSSHPRYRWSTVKQARSGCAIEGHAQRLS